jgi:hypothetical protein
MHVSFKIHYRNNLIDQKDSYPIPRPPSWDDRNYSYGHQLYPSAYVTYFNYPLEGHIRQVLLYIMIRQVPLYIVTMNFMG